MKLKFLLVGMAILSLCVLVESTEAVNLEKGSQSQSVKLSMMTYNIQGARHSTHLVRYTDNPLSTEQDLEKIAKVIEKNKPDILFAQEVMRFDPYVDNIDEFKWLQDRLDYPHAVFASGHKDPVPPKTPEWGVALYFRTGSIVSSRKYRIGNGRALLHVTISIHGTPMHFFCTHLGSGEILRQARVVRKVLSAKLPFALDYTALNEPIILGGDFNAAPESNKLAPIRKSLRNIFEDSEEQPIDSFFVSSDIEVLEAEVVEDETEASDHNPVICVQKIPLCRQDVTGE